MRAMVVASDDAYTLFLRARSAVTSAQYPSRLDYTIAVSGMDGEKPASDHYRASYDPETGAIRVFPISDEQLAGPPPVPHGVNAKVTIGICFGLCAVISQSVGHPAPYQDLLGEPLLDPTYMFGLAFRSYTGDATPGPAEPGALPVIAVVATRARDYDVSLVDTPTIDGVTTYHLKLSPRRKPKQNRLRELWIGERDYLPRRAVVAGNFTVAPLVDVPWLVTFSVIDGLPYVTCESAGATLYLAHRRVVRDAQIAFENLRSASESIVGEPLIAPAVTATTLVEPRSHG